jgi:large subunit ribosomal protein L14e
MFEVGRLVVKIAGRDAGLKGVIVDVLDKGYVLIDGQVRRRKCNVIHIEPLDKVVKLPKQATHEEVVSALKAEKIEVSEKKAKKAEKSARPIRQRKAKPSEAKTEEPKKEVKAKKKDVKKE